MFLKKFLIAVLAVMAVRGDVDEDDDFDFDEPETPDMEGEMDMESMLMEQAKTDFDSMDMDKDGKLSADDLKKYLDDPEMENEVTEFMSKADTDGDGFVTLEDYVKFIQAVLQDYHGPQEGMGGDESLEDLEEDEEEL
jgi:Ca2+-binding EF-hand superfamily protein